MESNSVYFKHGEPLNVLRGITDDEVICSTTEKVTIPAFSEKLVSVISNRNIEGDHLFKRLNQSNLLAMGICAAIGVVTCEASKPFNISLANVTGNEIELNAKTIIGTLQKFDCQDTELYEYEQPLQAE